MGPVRGLRDHVPMARPVRGLGAPEGDLGPLGPRRGHSLLSSRLNSARMAKRDLLRRKVEDIDISPSSEVARLVEAMGRGGGFTAKKIAVGVEILRTMFRRPACTTFLSFPAALMATGVRGVLRALVEEKLVDVVVTTCGTADHDLARVWQPYFHGDFELDDVALHRLGVNRLGNVLIPNASYGVVLEKKIQPMLRDLWDSGVRAPSTSELLWELGRRTGSRQSLLWWAWKNRIPVVVPAMFDGAGGYQLWSVWHEDKAFAIDQFRGEADLADLVFRAKEAGALMIGGGVSQPHTTRWHPFSGGVDS